MRSITPELEALLRSRFQAAGDGYSGRIEIDYPTAATSPTDIVLGPLQEPGFGADRWVDANHETWQPLLGGHSQVIGFTEIITFGSFHIWWHYGGAFTQVGAPGPVSGAAGPFTLEGAPTPSGPWTMVIDEPSSPATVAGATYPEDFDLVYTLASPATYRYWRITSTDPGANNDIYEIEGATPGLAAGYITTAYRPKRIGINRNRRMGPDQLSAEFANEQLPFGWGPTSIIPTNIRIRAYEWYGDEANALLVFTGVVDKVGDGRDVLTTALECRSMAGPILVDQTFSTTAPQGADETGTLRTEANGVYLAREVSYIATAVVVGAGWPADLIDVADTSFVLDEFLIEDGASGWDTLARLAELAGYDLWDDEDGILHFRLLGASATADDTLSPDYEYEIGIA